jgi:signal transduction histidine kinase
MTLSVIFSITIYQVTSNEIQVHLERFQTSLQQSQEFTPPPIGAAALRGREVDAVTANLSIELVYVNLFVLIVGGFGSYFLARRSLLPIEKAHEAQSRFTSDASHELRTPLAVMKTELEVALRDSAATTDSLKEVLSSNLEEVDKLSRLAEMLLNLSQLDQTKLKLGPVNLNKISLGIIKDFNKPSNRISLTSDKKLTVKGNEMTITDLIKVLVENAIQYSPKDSQVSITLSQFEEYAKFEITNSGPGVQPDKLPYIFDRFYRADSSRTNGKNKGYGFGLALAKNIVELHNGKLFVSSAPDYETTFTFLLPLYSNIQAKIQN